MDDSTLKYTVGDFLKDILQTQMNNRIYVSEADFQHELAMKLEKACGSDGGKVRCEFPVEIENHRYEYIDIVVFYQGGVVPIELKYRTQKIDVKVGGEITAIHLRGHGAHDEGCFGFWRDVQRIGRFVKNNGNCECGYVVFLTNDKWYWKHEGISDKYKQFDMCLTNQMNRKGIISGRERELNDVPCIGSIQWQELINLQGKRNGDFQYCLTKVERLKQRSRGYPEILEHNK